MICSPAQGALMELSAADPWGAPAAATAGSSAGPSPPSTLPAPTTSGPWGPAPADPWGVASPTSPTSSDPWGGGAPPPAIAPPPDPWGETSNRVNNVDPWGSTGKQPQHWPGINAGPRPALVNRAGVKTSRPLIPVPFSLVSPCCRILHTHTLSFCSDESKHAKSTLPLCLNQGFVSSCFYSGLTGCVSTRAVSCLSLFCASF